MDARPPRRSSATIPTELWTVVALLSVWGLVELWVPFSTTSSRVFYLLTTIAVLTFLMQGQTLAWQFSRFSSILLNLANGFFFGPPREHPKTEVVVTVAKLVVLLTCFFLLGRPAVRIFFHLQCPSCGGLKAKGTNLFLTQRRCTRCGTIWPEAT